MKLVTVAEMQTIEREANASGFTYEMMMENAGNGLAEVVDEVYAPRKADGVLGLVGSGNNGGDTLVALARLAFQGWRACAYLARPRPADDPLIQSLVNAGGKIYQEAEDPEFNHLATLVADHAVFMDGVLGTGMRLPLKPELAMVLGTAKRLLDEQADRPAVVAVDCPSGVDCDTGEAAPECLPAELTVTMAAVKQGLLKFPAYKLVGDLRVVGIGLPDGGANLAAWQAIRRSVISAERVKAILPARPLDAHKGTFGTALVVAGSVNYTGAAWLAGQAAYRIGAGLVTLAVPETLHSALAGQFPEATWLLMPHELGVISKEAAEVLQKPLKHATAFLVGPGFGLEDTTGEFLARLVTGGHRYPRAGIGFVHPATQGSDQPARLPPLVIDADGLKLLARIPDWPSLLPSLAVLTPHPGEMSVLTGLSKEEIQADRLGVAERFSQLWGHIVVLKGAFTVVAAPDGQTAMVPVATPALARAGTGDVLAGLVVGLRAQGVEAFSAAVAATWIHAQAGLRATITLGSTAAVLAGDVLRAIPVVISELDQN
jgi:ADP-dependent NAD(P)H-hydrate dehydratase / NAD(P)H-hydrate epimerase